MPLNAGATRVDSLAIGTDSRGLVALAASIAGLILLALVVAVIALIVRRGNRSSGTAMYDMPDDAATWESAYGITEDDSAGIEYTNTLDSEGGSWGMFTSANDLSQTIEIEEGAPFA
jgi:hypothetical protein